MIKNTNYANYKDLQNIAFINAVGLAEKEGKIVAITESGIVFEKQYAEILRVVNNNPYLIFDIPDHMIVQPELIYAMFDVIGSKAKELLSSNKNRLDLVHEISKYEADVNKFLKGKETLLKINLPKLEINTAQAFQNEPQQ